MKALTSIAVSFLFTSQLYAYNCDSDCHAESRFRYPCPTITNLGRKCWGKNWAKLATCESDKAFSCRAVAWFSEKAKPMLIGEFNARTFAAAEVSNETAQYMSLCTGAATAACAVIGTEFGGPYGTVIGGAGGAFISYQICKQSTTW